MSDAKDLLCSRPSLAANRMISLWTWPIAARKLDMRTHQQIDRLNLELGRAVAEKLRQQPALFDNVVRHKLQRWRASVDGGDSSSRRYLEQWESLATRGLEACLAQVVEESERATALRQASPFAGVLTSAERMQIIRALRAENEARRS